MKHKELPDTQELLNRYEYDADTGELTRKSTGNVISAKNTTGSVILSHGRGKQYLAHRIIWKIMTGEDPGELEIDHINRNRCDNRWCNLRLTTKQENSNNKPGRGITQDKRTGKWRATLQVARKKMHVGVYECPLMARIGYEDKSRELRGEYSPV